jgi:hypothetical protein
MTDQFNAIIQQLEIQLAAADMQVEILASAADEAERNEAIPIEDVNKVLNRMRASQKKADLIHKQILAVQELLYLQSKIEA